MKEGEGKYTIDKNGRKQTIRLVDVPGHQRLRVIEQSLLSSAAGIVFLVDASEWNVRAVAEHLYELLVNKIVNKREVPFLIFCNKIDLGTAVPTTAIQSDLENELDQLRRTRQAMPQEIGSKDREDNVYLGLEGKPFKFDQVHFDVTFKEGSVKDKSISSIIDFIGQC